MKNFASWFVGKTGEDDKHRQLILDSSKSFRKRIGSLSYIMKLNEKHGLNPDKCPDFIKSNHIMLMDICIGFLRNDTTRTKGKAAWDEISSTLKILIDLTRYRYPAPIDTIQEIAIACLNENNRIELREIGFNLVLNLMNNDVNLEVLSVLFLSSIDLAQLVNEESKGKLHFMNKSSISSPPNSLDSNWVNLVRTAEKPGENVQTKSLGELEKVCGSLQKGAKDCIFFLNKALEYAIMFEGSTRVDQFRRWFIMLKQTILYLLYPGLCKCQGAMGHDWGFRDGLPPILHYVVVKWIIQIIKTPDLNPVLMDLNGEFEFVVNLIGESFKLTESYNLSCSESASACIRIYEEWMFQNCMTEEIKNNWSEVMSKLLEYPITLFDFSQDSSSRRVNLCKEFLKMLTDSKSNGFDRKILLVCALNLSIKTLETHDPNRSLQDIIDPISEFLISLLADSIELVQISWSDYTDILKNWSIKSEFIIQTWLEKMKPITSTLKERQFQQSDLLDGWLSMLQLLGDPLKFQEKVQIKWVQALHELLVMNVLIQPQISPPPNFMLDIFFITLSKLIRQGAKESQRLSLIILVTIFSNTKCREMPMQCYLQHLSLLLFLSGEKEYLWKEVLDAAPKVLEYPGMHFMIYNFLKIAKNARVHSLKFIFYIMCLPNYYGKTKLENTEGLDLTYDGLKPIIQEHLVKCVDESEIAVSALYGLTVFILEELDAGNDEISELVTHVIQNKCLSDNEDVAITALICLQALSLSFPNLSKSILDFLISKCLSDIPNSKEKVLKSVLNTIQNWLLVNNSVPCDSALLSNLFSKLSLKLSSIDSSNPLEAEISMLVSFISIYYLNFPFKGHNSTVFHSILSDEAFAENSTSRPLHYALGNSVIFTMIPHAEKAKFVLRNQFGRFCWEAFDFMVFEPSTNSEEVEKALSIMRDAKIELDIREPPPPLQDEPLLPKLIKFIADNYPECYVPEKPIEAGGEILKMIESVEKIESECHYEEKRVDRERPQFNMGRYFIANFGLIDKLVQLQPDEKFERGLGILDSLKPRESVKIGVIYVAPGQQEEKEILANSGGSLEFQEFLQNLGEVIELQDHQGNLGGLDPNGTAGKISVSYADWQYDVIFHIVPLMPTDPNDDQQVLKKRHVGNDIVHIVWSDHYRDYRQDTMLTHFNFVIIVIYPLSKGLFRIQIYRKTNSDYGPLQDGMVVPAHLLASLVRQTAIYANQQARLSKHPNWEKQTQIRRKQIQELIQRYPVQNPQKHLVYSSMF
ncbi:hypothetical protein SteCoe_24589 [Stentor coeruleus]|uniref:Rap-GAP domain-containing protein n=1 Tax=Stentor coeruleus TaxID=5963 RepID=A0A1R2BH56_9CILI|nr:hypothetical protein SteCoe_24589 [Stentor coeruleus]